MQVDEVCSLQCYWSLILLEACLIGFDNEVSKKVEFSVAKYVKIFHEVKKSFYINNPASL